MRCDQHSGHKKGVARHNLAETAGVSSHTALERSPGCAPLCDINTQGSQGNIGQEAGAPGCPTKPQTLKTCLRPKAFPERATGAWRVPGPQLSSENPSMPSEGKPLCTWSRKSSTLTPVWSTICLDSRVYQVPKDILSRRITACPSSCSKVWVHCSLLPFAVVLHPPEKLPARDPWVLEMTSVNSFKTQSSQQTKRPTQGFGLHEQEAGRSDVNHPYTSSGRITNGNKCHFGFRMS